MNSQEVDQVEEVEVETSLHDELAESFEALNEVEAEEPVEVLEPLEAPEFFRPEHKEVFQGLDNRDAQQAWLDNYNEGQESFNKKSQELGDWKQHRNQYNQYQQAIQPVLNDWRMAGIDPAIKVAQYVSYEQALKQDPTGTLLKLAAENGVNLEEAFAEQPYIDPTVRTLQQQNSQLQQQQQQQSQQFQQWQQAQDTQRINSEIEGFRASNEHVDLVENDMANLINMGKANDLQEAYDLAIKYNPEVQAINHKNDIAKKQADVKKAKSATSRVASKTNTAPEAEMDLRAHLESNWSE